ncbi:MAG: NUDIX domain-containing protein [Halolamina sp.]
MEVHDGYVPDERFRAFLETMPQACVELVVKTEDGVLLCKRAVEPAVWFWPGSRLYKGEQLEAAAHRVAQEELGIEISLTEQLGIQSHFWSAEQTAEGVSRHTVNTVYLATPVAPAVEIELDDQHTAYRFVTEDSPAFHEYVREYLTEYDLV